MVMRWKWIKGAGNPVDKVQIHFWAMRRRREDEEGAVEDGLVLRASLLLIHTPLVYQWK